MKCLFTPLILLSLLTSLQAEETKIEKKVKEPRGPFISADLLYWEAQEDQLLYAARLSEDLGANLPKKFTLKEQGFSPNFGFRIGTGYRAILSNWEVSFFWTDFHSHTTSSVKDPNQIVAIEILGSQEGLILGSKASSDWHLSMNMFDLEFGQNYMPNKHFSLRGFMGLRGGWIDQKQAIHYPQFTDSSNDTTFNSEVKKYNDFKGIGPRFGVFSRWHLPYHFGLFGDLNTALLYGFFDVKNATELTYSESDQRKGSSKESIHRLRPNLGLSLGLDWEYPIHIIGKIALFASYETQYWWDQWQASGPVTSLTSGQFHQTGDLTTHGLTAQLKLSF